MGNKKVCLDCRKSFSDNTNKELPCPSCRKAMLFLPHRFRPPKKTDDEKWRTVRYLIENGFFYQHIYKEIKCKNMDEHENYIDYPETLREAIEFVERYKEQAIK